MIRLTQGLSYVDNQLCIYFIKGDVMTDDMNANECADPTQNFTVELPCRMVERIERCAKEKGTSVDNVLIEAIDLLLRRR